jgi:hypothetical protein
MHAALFAGYLVLTLAPVPHPPGVHVGPPRGGAAADSAPPPAWFRDLLRRHTAGSGRWIADNAAYRSDAEPADAYGVEWRLGLGNQTLHGRLFGLRDGKEIATYWEFWMIWHPGDRRVLAHQLGAWGTLGVGPMEPDGRGGTVLHQVFYDLDGAQRRVRHDSRFEGDTEITTSYDWVNGAWVKRRTYVWQRQ